ncbi:MAG: nickel-dependent hydrogenase large subunit [Calditrichaeota bacterium]|nr:MAG: nickel-dependent hydrogenase large subunit [Calditrichota bacterium]
MMARIVVDPITRIEGHLRIEAVVENGVITDAFSSGMMVRGLEIILKGRDPRDAWAFTQRACGVCTTVHALASVRTVEDAIGISVPRNAELIRNIMEAALYVQDHVVHFYHLHALDWVDVVSALSANPQSTAGIAQSISNWPKSSTGYFKDVQKRIKTFVESGQLGIFANGYWGHSAFKLPAEINLLAVAHYLEALEWQKEIVKVHAIFGGKNPHPNYLVGGVPCSINLNEVNAINSERLNHVAKLIKDANTFVNQVYIPDLLAIAGYYKDWGAHGGGLSNYLSYGDFPTNGYNEPTSFKIPRGIILNRDLSQVHPVDTKNADEVREYIKHSWYKYGDGEDAGLHPFEGETEFNYTGPKPPFKNLDTNGKYSWVKTPRWKDKAMEVGPLSRVLIAYASGSTEVQDIVNATLKKLDVPVAALFSTLGRTAARGLETVLIGGWMQGFFDDLVANIKAGDTTTFTQEKWEPSSWPKECEGVGMTEAPRGALAHFIKIKDGIIDNYQLVVPTTWNASPKDPNGQRSSYEEALIGTPVANIDQPLEILRTIHSFDPCLACAVHLYDPEGKHIHEIKVV